MTFSVSKIGVVGAGQMGRGIAQVAMTSDFEVRLFDSSHDALKIAEAFIHKQLQKGVEKGKHTTAFTEGCMDKLSLCYEMSALHDCDLVIEAATENKKIKFELMEKLDQIMNPQSILASNTSSISITELGARTKRPSKVVGMHFMNPVPVMKLVEGISGLETSPECMETITQVAKKMGKVMVRSADMPGFAVNRILMPMINEAVFTLFEGIATRDDIDTAMKLGTNQPMGPLELADFIGLDTCLSILNVMFEGLGDPKYRPCPLLKNYVAANRLGRKNGRGFYDYIN